MDIILNCLLIIIDSGNLTNAGGKAGNRDQMKAFISPTVRHHSIETDKSSKSVAVPPLFRLDLGTFTAATNAENNLTKIVVTENPGKEVGDSRLKRKRVVDDEHHLERDGKQIDVEIPSNA